MIVRSLGAALLALSICGAGLSSARAADIAAQRDLVNGATFGLISGGVTGTYVRIAADLVNALDDRYRLRNQNPTPPAGEERSVADLSSEQPPGARGTRSLAVKASLDSAASGAENMVFRIELSQPAEQTIVLIYGTVRRHGQGGQGLRAAAGHGDARPRHKESRGARPPHRAAELRGREEL